MPPAPASAEPSPKVKEMMNELLIPMSDAAAELWETARMAIPIRVFFTMKVSATNKTTVTPRTTICVVLNDSPPIEKFPVGRSCGNARWEAPKKALCWQVY